MQKRQEKLCFSQNHPEAILNQKYSVNKKNKIVYAKVGRFSTLRRKNGDENRHLSIVKSSGNYPPAQTFSLSGILPYARLPALR